MTVALSTFKSRWYEVEVQFRLLRFALSTLPKRKLHGFLKQLRAEKTQEINATWDATRDSMLQTLKSVAPPEALDFVSKVIEMSRKDELRDIKRQHGKANY